MTLKLVGIPTSTCTRRVAVVAKEAGVPFEIVTVDYLKGEHKSPAFLAKQPFGQVPYLDDDGFILFESRAIARYIAAKSGNTSLLPTEPKARARFDQAASIEASNFEPYAVGIAVQRVFAPMQGGKTDEARVTEFATALEGKLEGYERILAKQKYLAGDELTIVDLFHLPHGTMLEPQGITFLTDEKKFPNVARWWKDLTSRPSWQAVKDGNY